MRGGSGSGYRLGYQPIAILRPLRFCKDAATAALPPGKCRCTDLGFRNN